jgi:hypothetical protein
VTDVADHRPAPAASPPRPDRLRRLAWFAPPVVAYLLSHVLCLVAAERTGYRYFAVAPHVRWDSGLYDLIAAHGYLLERCPGNPGAWCGTAAWFPAYPALTRLVMLTGLSVHPSALLVAELATLGTLVLFWWLLRRPAPGARPDRAPLRDAALLALVAVYPGAIYYHVIYPMTLVVAATLAALGLASRGRWGWAGLAGAVAAAAYPIGILAGIAAVAVSAEASWRERAGWRRLLGRSAVVGGLSVAGTLLVFLIMQLTVGHWNAFFLSQEKYGGQRNNPVTAFVSLVSQVQTSPAVVNFPASVGHKLDVAVRTEIWASLGLVLLCCVAAVVAGVRRRFVPLDAGLVVLAVVGYLLPLFAGTQIAQYRSHVLLLPALLLLRHLPGWLIALLVVPSAVLAYKFGVLFFENYLI